LAAQLGQHRDIEEGILRRADKPAVTAPKPVLWVLHETRSHGVEVNVSEEVF
jgi:hypothetical protein